MPSRETSDASRASSAAVEGFRTGEPPSSNRKTINRTLAIVFTDNIMSHCQRKTQGHSEDKSNSKAERSLATCAESSATSVARVPAMS
nr:hypothetical protein Iba_chr11aCG2200 [Ipomoea batatas]